VTPQAWPRIASFKTPDDFTRRLAELEMDLPFEAEVERAPVSPMARGAEVDGHPIGNRYCILPMEGWDGTLDGHPSELTIRRWRNFGLSGAKLIWGGEAVAVRHDGRANPNQLLINEATLPSLAALRETLVAVHAERFGRSDDLLVGVQLTHSGRYARPHPSHRWQPLVAYRHPVLDRRFPAGVEPHCLTDEELDRLIDDFVQASVRVQRAGFQFVDIKHCHGYLGHELLSGIDRPGRYGGSFENRTRFLRSVTAGIRREAPGLGIAVRFSAFDVVPYRKDLAGVGTPEEDPAAYRHAFGPLTGSRLPDLTEPVQLLELLRALGIRLACISAGSPYYSPHIQRPALFPPSDGYLPPEDPLVGVARQIAVTAALKRRVPDLMFVGSGYTYLQEWLPNVAQAVARAGAADFIGLGRMVLAYPDLPADVLEGRPLRRKTLCRTFSDCTSGPRNGLVSGCYPLDPFYAQHPHAAKLKAAKAALVSG
jgi:NADPH2 dehydrogenase